MEFESAEEFEQRQLLGKTPAVVQCPQLPVAQPQATPGAPLLSEPISKATKPRIEFDPIFGLRHLVDVWYFIYPDIPLYPWQKEELYRLSGYVNGNPNGPRKHYSPDDPYFASYVCANGSGKDKVIISTLAIGLPLLYKGVYVVVTSASHKQLESQTEIHVTTAIKKLNEKFRAAGANVDLFDSVRFHHRCPSRGAEVILFATDEAGKAEGWHPTEYPGQLVLIVNEAKSIDPEILDAFDRCWGYSHWVEISSPSGRSGQFYRNFKSSIKYPAPAERFKYFGRRVSYHECPHITEDYANFVKNKKGEASHIYQTGFLANFWEEEEGVVIPAGIVDDCEDVLKQEGPIGIGLDCAAGGDEMVLIVRRGNYILDIFPFVEKDTGIATDRVDLRLDAYRNEDYTFNIDDGGIGRAYSDNLTKLGWRVIKRHNQSAAYQPKEFANLGAEMYWHVRDLFQARKIVKPADDTLYTQLITRRLETSEGLGKKKLQSKKRIRENGGTSPDRADAFVLAFFSFRPKLAQTPTPFKDPYEDLSSLPAMSYKDLAKWLRRNPNFDLKPKPAVTGRYTCQHF